MNSCYILQTKTAQNQQETDKETETKTYEQPLQERVEGELFWHRI